MKRCHASSRSRMLHAALFAVAISSFAATVAAVVPNPTVTGPIPGVTPGDPSHNYPFFATDVDLASRGYIEQEFFIEGSRPSRASVWR